ncbi:MAG: hypothetical protein GX561_08275 [Lentisphaerae bacterium]|jgi:hypothetical protein|nr:hypothetical protein [Lentisphaerota bacterium]
MATLKVLYLTESKKKRRNKMQEFVESFKVKSEDGQIFTLNVFQKYIIERTRGNGELKIPGLKMLLTSNGDFVNKDEKNENVFYILGEKKVTRIS